MEKDVIYVVSSDDEDAPPKKQSKLNEIANLKGMTVKKVKNSPEKNLAPMFKSNLDLNSKKQTPDTNSRKTNVESLEKRPNKREMIDLTQNVYVGPMKKKIPSDTNISPRIAVASTSTSATVNKNASPSSSSLLKPISSAPCPASKKPIPLNDRTASLSKPNSVNSPSSSSSTLLSPSTSSSIKKPSPVISPVSILKVQSMGKPTKRITPKTLSSSVSIRLNSLEKSSDSEAASQDETEKLPENGRTEEPSNNDNDLHEPAAKQRKVDETPKTKLSAEFQVLIEACKKADETADMQKLIDRKLIKYYQSVHPKFAESKSFRKTVSEATRAIEAKPNLVYVTISGLLEELKTRRDNSKIMVVDDPDPDPNESITGDEKKDLKIRKLSKALHKLKQKISKLEEAEVDFNDEENSQYLISERCKSRAWAIYEKICDLTGESKDAQRLVKKPIQFRDSPHREFNRMLESFVNKTRTFPDMFDVVRCMDQCNKQFNYRMNKEEIQSQAKLAFIQIGRQLQKRRKSDLYEMVAYYTQDNKDPALEDQMLKVKLEENQKQHNRKMKEVFDKFACDQDNSNDKTDDTNNDPQPSTSNASNNTAETNNSNEPSTSNALNQSAMTISSAGSNLFDDANSMMPDANDMDLLSVTKFEAPITLDDDDIDLPLEITNVMTIDSFNFGDSQVDAL